MLYFVVHCVMIYWKSSYSCLQVVLFEGKICLLHILNVLARLEPFANKMCHFDRECHCSACVLTVLKNVEFELTAASKQSRKTVSNSFSRYCFPSDVTTSTLLTETLP